MSFKQFGTLFLVLVMSLLFVSCTEDEELSLEVNDAVLADGVGDDANAMVSRWGFTSEWTVPNANAWGTRFQTR
jgi:hypothetical protein